MGGHKNYVTTCKGRVTRQASGHLSRSTPQWVEFSAIYTTIQYYVSLITRRQSRARQSSSPASGDSSSARLFQDLRFSNNIFRIKKDVGVYIEASLSVCHLNRTPLLMRPLHSMSKEHQHVTLHSSSQQQQPIMLGRFTRRCYKDLSSK